MIDFSYQKEGFHIDGTIKLQKWLEDFIRLEGCSLGDVSFVFCDDEYLLQINKEFLDHDYYTDIISFDYRLGNQLNGEIYISVDRVKDNADELGLEFDEEMHRVMAHGILHFIGYKDKTATEQMDMRRKENEVLELRRFT